ncbi:MFS transporter, partial [bacterium]|nr:MFS transporter [bacterium]
MTSQIDYSKKWFTLIATGMGIFLCTVDGSIVNVALPTLVPALKTDFSVIQWVVLGYLLTVSTLMLSIGRLGDMIGKKPLYTAGFVIFTAGSVLCGSASSVYFLIVFRIIQALGSALIMALGMAIVTEAFPPSERGKALGISGTIVSVGIAIGPSLGGIIMTFLSWRWIFLVNLPIGIVGTYAVIKFVQPGNVEGKQKFDFMGSLLMFFSILSLLLGLTIGQQKGFNQPLIFILFGICLLTLVLFAIAESRIKQPMINLLFFKNSLFSINLTNGFIAFIGVSGTIILLPFYLQNILQYQTIIVGLLLCVVPVALGISSPIAGILSDRFGTRLISTLGLVVVFIGFYMASSLNENTTAIGYIIRLLPLGIGMGIFQSPNNSAIMGSVPKEHLGISSGLVSLSRTLGQTVGVAVLGTLWASRTFYHAGVNQSGGATTAPAAAQVAALQDTFLVVVGFISVTWRPTAFLSLIEKKSSLALARKRIIP